MPATSSLVLLLLLHTCVVFTLQVFGTREETWFAEVDVARLARIKRQMSALDTGGTPTYHSDMQADRGEDTALWHSYQFGQKLHARDVLRVSSLNNLPDFSGSSFNVTRWITDVRTRHIALGVEPSSFVVCRFHVRNTSCSRTELTGMVSSATLFSARDSSSRQLNVYVVCAISSTLQWFQVQDTSLVRLESAWPLPHAPLELQVLFHESGQHVLTVLSVSHLELYHFTLQNTSIELWLSHKLHVKNATSSAISIQHDVMFFAIAQARQHVLVYHFQNHKFTFINKVPSPGVTSLCIFEINSIAFLAISGSQPRVLKMPPQDWDSTDLLHFSDESSVVRWLAVPVATYRDEVLILAETEALKVELVTWSAPSQFSVDVRNTFPCLQAHSRGEKSDCLQSLDGVAGLLMDKSVMLLLPQRLHEDEEFPVQPTLAVAITHLQHIECPSLLDRQFIINKRDAIQGVLHSHDEILAAAKNRLVNALHDNAVVTAPWTVEHVSADSVEVPQQVSVNTVQYAGQKWVQEDCDKLKDALDLDMSVQQEQIKSLQARLGEAVIVDREGNVEIHGSQKLEGNIEVLGNTYIRSAQFNSFNNHSVTQLLQNSVRLGKSAVIRGHKTVENLHAREIYVTDLLNDGPVHPFANQEGPIYLHGDVHFREQVVVNNSLAAIEHTDLRDSQTEMTHPELTVESVHVSDMVNQKPALRVNQDTENTLETVDTLHVTGNLDVITINGVDFRDLIDHSVPVFTLQPFHIPGDTLVTSCDLADVDVLAVNELEFPHQFVLQKSSVDVFGEKTFSKVEVNTLNVASDFLSQLVTLDSPQHIAANWTVEQLTVLGNLQTSTDFSHKLDLLSSNSASTLLDAPGGIVFTDLHVTGNVITANPHWQKLFEDIIYKDEHDPIIITGRKDFAGEVQIDSLELDGNLAGVSVSHFVTLNTDQTIPGEKILRRAMHVDKLDVSGNIIDIDLTSLASNVVRLSSDEVCSAELTFSEPLTVKGGLNTHWLNERENGDDFVTLDTAQNVLGPWHLERLSVDRLTVEGDVNTDNVINGVHMNSLEDDRVSLSKDQVITGAWSMSQAVVSHLDVDIVNNISVNNFAAQPLLENLKSLEAFNFAELHVFGDVNTKQINNIDFSKLVGDVIWLNSSNVIPSKLTVLGEITCSYLQISDSLNDKVRMPDLIFDIVQQQETNIEFEGHKTFLNGAHFKQVESDYVNGKKLKDVLTVHTDQEIPGHLKFVKPVKINGQVDVKYLNGHKVNDWNAKYSVDNGWHIVHGDVNFESTFNTNILYVKQSIAGRDLEVFIPSIVWIYDDSNIKASKTFTNDVEMEKNMFVADTINGVDLSQLMQNVVLIDRINEISTPVIFAEDVFVEDEMTVLKHLNAQSLSGCKIKDWLQNAIYLDQQVPVLGSLYFESLSSYGPINTKVLNGISTDRFVTLHEDQFIPEVMTFSRVVTGGDVNVGGLVNDVRIDHEQQDTLMTEGDQEVLAQKTFTGGVTIRRDLIPYGTLNGYKITDFVTLHTDQVIYGLKEFEKLIVNGDVRVLGQVSGNDVETWYNRVVMRNSDAGVINGHWKVHGNITVLGSVLGDPSTLLSTVHLPSLLDTHNKRTQEANENIKVMASDQNIFCQNLQQLLGTAQNQTYIFDHLEARQYYSTDHPVLSYVHFKLGATHMIAVSFAGTCSGALLTWQRETTQFTLALSTLLGQINSWAVLPSQQDVMLISASEPASKDTCQHSGGNLWLLRNTLPLQLVHMKYLGAWIHVENSPWSSNVIYARDSEDQVSEWTYVENQGLINTGHLGSATSDGLGITTSNIQRSSTVEQLQNGDVRNVTNDKIKSALSLGHDTHSFSMPLNRGLQGSPYTANFNTNFTVTTLRHAATVHDKHDDIKVFEGSDEKLFHKISATKPGLVKSVHFGAARENLLVFMDNEDTLNLLRYEGVGGFSAMTSAYFPGAQLLGIESLPTRDLISPRAFVLLATPLPTPGLFVVELCMFGDPVTNVNLPPACYASN